MNVNGLVVLGTGGAANFFFRVADDGTFLKLHD